MFPVATGCIGTYAQKARGSSCTTGTPTGILHAAIRHRRNIAQVTLLCPRSAALNQHDQNHDEQYASDNLNKCGASHIDPSFPQWPNVDEKDSIIKMAAGPRTTRKSDGKIKNTSGKINLIVVFAAASSTCCTRFFLSSSE